MNLKIEQSSFSNRTYESQRKPNRESNNNRPNVIFKNEKQNASSSGQLGYPSHSDKVSEEDVPREKSENKNNQQLDLQMKEQPSVAHSPIQERNFMHASPGENSLNQAQLLEEIIRA